MIDGGSGAGGMTLACSLSAVDRLADPATAFEEARAWSRFVGVVDNDVDAVADAVADHGLPQDFHLDAEQDVWLAMERIRERTRTPRHVYVGTAEADRRIATQLGWEFVHVAEAAEKADWELADGDSEAGTLSRVRETVLGLLGPFGDA